MCNVSLLLCLARVLSLRFIALDASSFNFQVFVLLLAFIPVFFNMAEKKRRRGAELRYLLRVNLPCHMCALACSGGQSHDDCVLINASPRKAHKRLGVR